MIVADDAEHAAMLRCAGRMCVADRVDTAVYSRTFAVPERVDAVIFRVSKDANLLGTPYCRRS